MFKKITVGIAMACVGLMFTGCAKDLPPGSYDANEIGKVKKVSSGVLISKRPINIFAKKPDSSQEAMDAQPISNVKRSPHGYEYIVKLNDGEIVSIAQDEDLKLKVKQHVLVIYGDNTRVVSDDGED